MSSSYQLQLPGLPAAAQRANKRRLNAQRSVEAADFFTIGYSGHSTASFRDTLAQAGVRTLVDIRHRAFSQYKPEFNTKSLEASLCEADIDYVHLPNLGVPRDVRAMAVGRSTRRGIWAWYDTWVVERFATRNLDWFFNAGEHPLALMCVELDPTSCHRHRLAIALERQGLRFFDL